MLVSEAVGSRDHEADRVEFVPVQRFIFVQVKIEGQAVEAKLGELRKRLFRWALPARVIEPRR